MSVAEDLSIEEEEPTDFDLEDAAGKQESSGLKRCRCGCQRLIPKGQEFYPGHSMKHRGMPEWKERLLQKLTVVRCARCPDFAVEVPGDTAAKTFAAHARFAHRDAAETP